MSALSLKKFKTFPQYAPPSCGSSMAHWCPCDTPVREIGYNSRMKHPALSLIAVTTLLAITALPSAAKTKVELKDSQGKAVGTIILWQKKPGVGLKLQLH